ncbi:MAG: hypothetical protein JEZ12_27910 [Desulfobacterium sp.]|nr:hypothetical protein [Desulfobacterium sp.]
MAFNIPGNNEAGDFVRRPAFEVNFGSGGTAGGLTAGVGLGADDHWASSVVRLNVEMGQAPFVDVVTVEIAANRDAPEVALDDPGTISLGYEDSAVELVFTAMVDHISSSLHGARRLQGGDGGSLLSRLRINQSYEQQSAGDIVNDLAGQAGVGIDTVESGIDLPFYVLDDRSNAYEHINTLARKSGYLTYFTPEGKLYFGPYAEGQAVQTFTHGMDILSLQVQETIPVVQSVTTIGEGAAGGEGQEAWSWLIKDPAPVTAHAGQGELVGITSDPSLRSSEAGQSAADSLADAAGQMALTGMIIVPGAPLVKVGSTIGIADVPQDSVNGACRVSWVGHRYSKQLGFISVIEFSKSAADEGLP